MHRDFFRACEKAWAHDGASERWRKHPAMGSSALGIWRTGEIRGRSCMRPKTAAKRGMQPYIFRRMGRSAISRKSIGKTLSGGPLLPRVCIVSRFNDEAEIRDYGISGSGNQ